MYGIMTYMYLYEVWLYANGEKKVGFTEYNTDGKLLFCMNKKIEFEDLERELDKVMVEYKKALVRQKVQEIGKDFKV